MIATLHALFRVVDAHARTHAREGVYDILITDDEPDGRHAG